MSAPSAETQPAGGSTPDTGTQEVGSFSFRAASAMLPLIMLFGFSLRLARAWANSLWFDELYTVWSSRLPLDRLLEEVPASAHPPLYYLIGHFWFTEGSGELRLRAISLAAGLMTILLAYLLGRELFSRRAGLWAAALTAASPPLIRYASEATDYALMVMFVLASLFFLVKGVSKGGNRYWVLYVITAVAAVFTHLLAAIFLAAEVAIYLLLDRGPRRRLIQWLVSQAFLVLAAIPWYLVNRGASEEVMRIARSPADIAEALGRAPMLIITDSNHAPVDRFWVLFLGAIVVLGLLLIAIRPARAVMVSRQGSSLLAGIMLVAVLTVPVVLFMQDMAVVDMSSRYFLTAVVPLMVLAGATIAALPTKPVRMAAGAILVAALVWSSWPTLRTQVWDYRTLIEKIGTGYRSGDRVLCFPMHHCVVAAGVYASTDLDIRGGWVIDEEEGTMLFLEDPASTWQGYSAANEHVLVGGADLERMLSEQQRGAGRIWLLVGDGSFDLAPEGAAVRRVVEEDWVEVERFDVDAPFVLRLYEPRRSADG